MAARADALRPLLPRALLDLRPRVAEGDGAVEDGPAGGGVRVGAEVAEALELVAGAREGVRQARLDEAVLHLERVRVQVVQVGLPGLHVVRVRLREEMI